MPRLSIVIPCTQDAGRFETTLASVLQNRPDDCEILVVQPRPYDDPYDLAGEVRFLEASADASTVAMINMGIRCADGIIVHVLSCDAEVVDGWCESAMLHFCDGSVGSVSPTILHPDDSERQPATLGVRYDAGGKRQLSQQRSSARWLVGQQRVLGPTLLAGFYRRQVVLDVGGFCEDVGEDLADVDMALALRAVGLRAIHENGSLLTVQPRRSRRRLTFRGGQQAERLFWRNTSISFWAQTLLLHPCHVAAEIFSNLYRPALMTRMLGRLAAVFEAPSYRHHRQRLLSVRVSDIPDSSLQSASDSARDSASRAVA